MTAPEEPTPYRPPESDVEEGHDPDHGKTPPVWRLGLLLVLLPGAASFLASIWILMSAFDEVAVAPPDTKTALLTEAVAIAGNTFAVGCLVSFVGIVVTIILRRRSKRREDS